MNNFPRSGKGLFFLICLMISSPWEGIAQEIGGTANPNPLGHSYSLMNRSGIVTSSVQMGESVSGFHTTFFTFNDIMLFSYFNDTAFNILDASGKEIYAGTLDASEFHTELAGRGVYTVRGSEPFSVLAGDPVSNIVMGYFAADHRGLGASTLFNTYMVGEFGDGKFIVFGYEDNTTFQVKNLETGQSLADGVLNRGEHYTFTDTPFDTYLQVIADKPVSALSHGDQGYYVPADNGTFSGTIFYGYSGYIGEWANSITVTSYRDNNHVVIRDSESGAVLASATLGRGQVLSHPVTSPTYWEVESEKTVTAASIPYAGWSGNYFYKTRVMGETGRGAGNLFYIPAIASMIDVFSFEDGNDVTISRLGEYTEFPYNKSSQEIVFEGTLHAGDRFNYFSNFGNHVYKVESSKQVSVLQRNGDSGADFMPLNYPDDESFPNVPGDPDYTDDTYDPDDSDSSDGSDDSDDSIGSDTPDAPSAPEHLVAQLTGGNNSRVLLSWTPNTSDNLSGYRIYYGTETGVYDGRKADQGSSPLSVGTISEFELSGLPRGKTEYFFALRAVDESGNFSDLSNEVSVVFMQTDRGRKNGLPEQFSIEQNFPNPFNPSTNIRFSLPETVHVEIILYDLSGREVSRLINETISAGIHTITLDMSTFGSGVYIYRMVAGSVVENRKLTLIK